MTPLRRLKTLEAFEQKLSGPVPNTWITVSKTIFEKDKEGHVRTYTPKDAVYKDKDGAILHKDEHGAWRYADGSPLKVTGLLLVFKEGCIP
jgi:hypothetical protein